MTKTEKMIEEKEPIHRRVYKSRRFMLAQQAFWALFIAFFFTDRMSDLQFVLGLSAVLSLYAASRSRFIEPDYGYDYPDAPPYRDHADDY